MLKPCMRYVVKKSQIYARADRSIHVYMQDTRNNKYNQIVYVCLFALISSQMNVRRQD